LASVAKFAAFALLAQGLLTTGVGAIEPIRIGVSGPFTGGSSPMGLSMRDGIRLAAQEINAAGGILGRPLRLIERDDEARPERGAQVAQELINREKIVAGLGIVNTGVALASQLLPAGARAHDHLGGHGFHHHQAVSAAPIPRQLHLPRVGAR